MISHPTSLESNIALLKPLETKDLDELAKQANEEEIWQYFRYGSLTKRHELSAWISEALELRARGIDYPFSTVEKASGRIAGSTRFRLIDMRNRCVEIGGSWLGKDFRGTGLNREAKRLMLTYAFEHLGCIRVQFRTDIRNRRSRSAIESIGAVQEGIFRKDYIYSDGLQRTSVFYSITDEDWPRVRILMAR